MSSIAVRIIIIAIFLGTSSLFITVHAKDKMEGGDHNSKQSEHQSMNHGGDAAMNHGSAHGHHHALQDVSHLSDPPTVSFTVTEDAASGWNIHLKTSNFTFAPESVNMEPMDGHGHAHLYVDEEKVARLYGPWFHLPALSPGRHSIKVQLNANDHATLALGSNPIEIITVITQH